MKHEDDVEETGPGAPLRREGDRRHRFFRFDPTVSTGILLNIIGTAVTIVVTLAMVYSSYREDRTAMLKDIEQMKSTAQRDRDDLRQAVTDLKIDIRDMKSDIRDVGRSLDSVARTQQQTQQPHR